MARFFLQNSLASAEITTDQGLMLRSLGLQGKNILFPDQLVETSAGKKRRGGIPLLFPNAGPLASEKPYPLPQHGFARDLPWKTENIQKSVATFSLQSSTHTEKLFPFQFDLQACLELGKDFLFYELSIENQSKVMLPVAPGFHPYFLLPTAERSAFKTSLSQFDAQSYNWSDPVAYPGQTKIQLKFPSDLSVLLECSPEFKTTMLWSEVEGDFVCVEPWIGPANALLDPKARLEFKPGETKKLFMKIKLEHEST